MTNLFNPYLNPRFEAMNQHPSTFEPELESDEEQAFDVEVMLNLPDDDVASETIHDVVKIALSSDNTVLRLIGKGNRLEAVYAEGAWIGAAILGETDRLEIKP